MQPSEIMTYSRQLFDQLGPKAIAVAAQRAEGAESDGDTSDHVSDSAAYGS